MTKALILFAGIFAIFFLLWAIPAMIDVIIYGPRILLTILNPFNWLRARQKLVDRNERFFKKMQSQSEAEPTSEKPKHKM